MQQPGMLLLAGGLPPAELFPFVRTVSSLVPTLRQLAVAD